MTSIFAIGWVNRLKARLFGQPLSSSRRARRRVQLGIEMLEHRIVPTLANTSNYLPVINAGEPFTFESLGQSQSVARDAHGDFAVVWQDNGGVYARVFGPTGNQETGLIHAPSTGSSDSEPAVAMNASGQFVIAWTHQVSGTDSNIEAQRFSLSGQSQGGQIAVATSSIAEDDPSVGMDATGDFVVTYQKEQSPNNVIVANLYSASGALRRATAVAPGNTRSQVLANVAMNDSGDFVVAFDYAYSTTDMDVGAQRFDASGNAAGSAITVAGSGQSEIRPAVAINSSGAFVIAYSTIVSQSTVTGGLGGTTFTSNVTVARYTAQGALQARTQVAGNGVEEVAYSTALDDEGNYLVAYQQAAPGQSGGGRTVHVRTVNNQNQPGNGSIAIPVALTSANEQENLMPSVAEDRSDGAVVAWVNTSNTGSEGLATNRVYYQTFTVSDYRMEGSLPQGQTEIDLTNGTSETVTLTIDRDPGFNGAVNLSVVGTLPAGVTWSASAPNPKAPATETRTVTFTASKTLSADGFDQVSIRAQSANEPEIDLPLNVRAMSGGITSVQGAPNVPDGTLVPGTPITISGRGLTVGSTVLFPNAKAGAAPIAVTASSPDSSGTELEATVPANIGNGTLAVRTPTGATYTAPGKFTVSQGAVTFVAPNKGNAPEDLEPGDTIWISGYGFVPGSKVQFGDPSNIDASQLAVPTSISANGSNLSVQVPPYAVNGQVTVVKPDGTKLVSPTNQTFTVENYRNTDGYSFGNFTFDVTFDMVSDAYGYDQTHVSVDDALGPVGLLGKLVGVDATTPVPSPGALAFTAFAAATLNGDGACFGMDLTSEILMNNVSTINSQFGLPDGQVPDVYNLPGKPAPASGPLSDNLASFIEHEHLYQFSAEMLRYFTGWETSSHDNVSIYNQLASLLTAGNNPMISVENSIGDGHVLVAYDLEGTPNDFYIDVYDVNRLDTQTEDTTLATRESQEQASRIHVVNGQWSFTFYSPSKNTMSNWGGGLDSMVVIPYGTLPSQPTLPTSLDGLATLVFGAAGANSGTITSGIPVLSRSTDGTLTINGSALSAASTNAITIVLDTAGDIQVTVNGVLTTYAPGTVTSINYYGGAGNDTLNLESAPANVPVTLYLGTGNDTVNLSPTARTLASLPGSVKITGGLGTDTVNIDDQADAANTTYTLTGSTFQEGGITIEHSLIDRLNINGGSGNDTYNILGTEQKFTTSITTGTGKNSINVKGSSGPLYVNGQAQNLVGIQIDAHALTTQNLLLDGTMTVNTQSVPTLTVLPGVHTLVAEDYGYYDASPVIFTVRGDGTVSYNSSLAEVLGGQGTSTLVVNGATVTIDAQALYTPRLTIDVTDAPRTASPISLTVLPGPQELMDTWATGNPILFSVAANGMVSYDPSLQGIVSGQGTSTLTVTGRTITIDARALSTPLLTVDVSNARPTSSPITINVLPGPQSIWDYYGSGETLNFNVNPDGTISYDTALAGILSGQGTSTLTVTPKTVTIDARALSTPLLTVDEGYARPTSSPITINVLPGPQSIWDYYGSGPTINFTVNPDGTISYDPSLARILSGQDTSTLTVTGKTVTIDPRNLSLYALVVDTTIVDRMTSAITLQLLPGDHWLTDNYGWSTPLHFTVNNDGTVSYDSALAGVFTGSGTSTLTLVGESLQIDASVISSESSYFIVATVGGLPAVQVQTIQVLPGTFQFTAGSEQFVFDLSALDSLSYDASLDAMLSGYGSNRLSVLS